MNSYWVKKIVANNRELIVLVIADCTGHGVPGAFVSMLGISLLSDIVSNGFKENNSLATNEILEELRLRIVKVRLNVELNKVFASTLPAFTCI